METPAPPDRRGSRRRRAWTLPILQAIQARYGYLPREALVRVCEITAISPAQIEGVATFYSRFRRAPTGSHLVSVCHGTACHVAGAERVTEALRRHLRLEGEADTDAAKRFTVQKVACLGCCSLAPVMRVDDRTYGRLTPENAGRTLEKFLHEEAARAKSGLNLAKVRTNLRKVPPEGAVEIRIGLGSCCIASGSLEVKERMDAALRGLGREASVKCGACIGMCHNVPLVEFIGADGRRARYGNVKPGAVASLLAGEKLRPVGLLRRAGATARRASDLLSRDAAWQSAKDYALDPKSDPVRAFLAKQKDVVLEGRGEMDPLDVEEYRARGGYQALEKCLRELSPEAVIRIVEASGLRGRGGAGFPAAAKWAAVRRQPERKKYIIMNGDEGDPGAFMDRMMLESYPHRILEGLAIAAYAVGADEAFLYIRAEYPLAVQRVREAIRQAAERGYFGEDILGSGFSLAPAGCGGRRRVRLRRGNRPDRLARRPPRHAALPAALPGRAMACGGGPRASTTWRPTPTCPGFSATAPRRSLPSGPPRAKGPRSSRSPERWSAAG